MPAPPVDLDYIKPCIDPDEDDSTDARREVLADFFKQVPVATKSDAVDFLCKYYPDISSGGHRGFVQREYPDREAWDATEKVCPKCSVKAEGNTEIQDVFGTRKSGGKIIPQSWCRGCR